VTRYWKAAVAFLAPGATLLIVDSNGGFTSGEVFAGREASATGDAEASRSGAALCCQSRIGCAGQSGFGSRRE
jgi:hypothetical protein